MACKQRGEVVKAERVQSGSLCDRLCQVQFRYGRSHINDLHVLRDRVARRIEKAIMETLLADVFHRGEHGGILRGEDDIHIFGELFRKSERVPPRTGVHQRAGLLLRKAERRIELPAEILFRPFISSVCDQDVVCILRPRVER